jgi:hypothetical protein
MPPCRTPRLSKDPKATTIDEQLEDRATEKKRPDGIIFFSDNQLNTARFSMCHWPPGISSPFSIDEERTGTKQKHQPYVLLQTSGTLKKHCSKRTIQKTTQHIAAKHLVPVASTRLCRWWIGIG